VKNSLLGDGEPTGIAYGLWIDERSAHRPQQCTSFVLHNARRDLALRAPRSLTIKEQAMQNGTNRVMRTRRPRPAASFTARPKQISNGGPKPNGSHNARRNYERYLELARAEASAGNTIAAENYYQHAEHYFRSMSAE
jgi:Domain of unknown function (DUF4167)